MWGVVVAAVVYNIVHAADNLIGNRGVLPPLMLADVETNGLRNLRHSIAENGSDVTLMPTLPSGARRFGARPIPRS